MARIHNGFIWAAIALASGLGARQALAQQARTAPPAQPPRIVPQVQPTAPAQPARPLEVVPQPAPVQPPAPAQPATRELSLEVRSARVGDLLAQFGAAVNIRLDADPGLAGQRVSVHAARTTPEGLQGALASLFRTTWRVSGEGPGARHRLANSAALYQEAGRLRGERRTFFLRRLLETEQAIRTQDNEQVAGRLRQAVSRAVPGMPRPALDNITADFVRQTLLLAPLRMGISQNLLRSGSVSVTFRSLPRAQQELFAEFMVQQLDGQQQQVAVAESANGAAAASPYVLNTPAARVEYRFLYGDRWSDELLMVRVGAPDNWATAYLPAILFNLEDYASLYPETETLPVGAELARKPKIEIDTDALTWDQALLAVAQTHGINVVTDSFLRPAVFRPTGIEPVLTAPTLGDLLNRMADHYGYTWWRHGDFFIFRNRLWADELRVQVPDNMLEAIGSSISRTQGLSPQNLVSLAALSDEQLLSLHLYGSAAGGPYARPEDLDLNEIRLVRSGLTLYAQLPEEQRALIRTTGVPFMLLSPAQQALMVNVAEERGAQLDFADSENWRLRTVEQFERRRLGGGWAEVGTLQLQFDFGQNGGRAATLAIRAPALEPAQPEEADR